MKLVFVSSTFKDMQFERDLLQTYAIPTLNSRLREYGEKAYFGDLRWGVNTTDMDSDEGSRKVLQVCLDQIDNCKPYMIVLIGERYGWIPAQELIDEACVLKGIDKIKDISVTELEIDYGALLNPDYEGRILFYFRNLDKTGMTDAQRRDYEAESDVHLQKIEELKKRIREVYPDQIRYYDAAWDAQKQEVGCLDGFLHQVEEDLSDIFLKDLEAYNSIPWQERCMQSAARWFEETNKYISDTVDYGERTYSGSALAEGGGRFLYITGPAGSGKTAWLTYTYCVCDEDKLAFSYGLDPYSTGNEQLLQVLIYKLEEMLDIPHDDYADAGLATLAERFLTLQEQVEFCRVFVDNAGEDFLTLLSWLEKEFWSGEYQAINVCFHIAMQEDLPFYPFFSYSRRRTLGALSEEDASSVLDSIIKSHHKELSHVVKAHILSKKQSRSAAYLKSIVKRLMILDSDDFAAIRAMGDGMDNINRYMISIVDEASDDQYGILLELIDEAKDRINQAFVDRLMAVFAYVPVGLSVAEIKALFCTLGWDFSDLDFSLSVRMLEDIIRYNPEFARYRIKNPAIEEVVKKSVKKFDVRPIANYMLTVDELRPYAFIAAINCDDFDFLCSVRKASGITDISRSIRYLINADESQKAIDLLIYLMKSEEAWDVKMLPDLDSFQTENDRRRADRFLTEFYRQARAHVTNETLLLQDMILKARLLQAEAIAREYPQRALEMMHEALDYIRSVATKGIDVNIVEDVFFVRLKAVNASKSPELFQHYIKDEGYLAHFKSDDPYYKTCLKLRAYYEFYEIADALDDDVIDSDIAIDCWNKAIELYDALSYTEELKPEDCICFAQFSESANELLFGKALYPLSYELLRSEIRLVSRKYDEFKSLGCKLDNLKKAKAMLSYTGAAMDAAQYLAATEGFLLSDEFEDIENEELCGYLDDYITFFAVLLEKEFLPYNNYVMLLPVVEHLWQYEDFDEQVLSLMEAAKSDDALHQIVWQFVQRYFIEDRDADALEEVFAQYLTLRGEYQSMGRVAVNILDYYFHEVGFDVPE